MRIFVLISALVVLCAQSAVAALSPIPSAPHAVSLIEGESWDSETVVYQCQPNTLLQVVYLNIKNGESFAVLHYQGNTSLLRSRETGSGTFYVAINEQNSLRWHTKGREGFLTFMAADHTAQEQRLLSDCKERPGA